MFHSVVQFYKICWRLCHQILWIAIYNKGRVSWTRDLFSRASLWSTTNLGVSSSDCQLLVDLENNTDLEVITVDKDRRRCFVTWGSMRPVPFLLLSSSRSHYFSSQLLSNTWNRKTEFWKGYLLAPSTPFLCLLQQPDSEGEWAPHCIPLLSAAAAGFSTNYCTTL